MRRDGKRKDPYGLALAGGRASKAEAARLESLLASNADDVESRIKLLGHYMQPSYTDVRARRRKNAHILWMIRHRPGDEIVGSPFCGIERFLDARSYRKAKALWKRQVEKHRDKTAVLSNAAHFHTHHEKRVAIGLLKRLQRMEPQNPDWCERLGHLYHLHAGVGPGRKRNKASAAHALKEWQAALALLQDDRERFYLLTKMAPGAVDAGRLREAVRYAREALRFASRFSEDWNHGNAVHHAHLALGRVALRRRQVSKARLHLIASARHKGSPQLDSFGPSQDLAVELLARGATKTVLRYLELCRTFWVMGHPQIDTWIKSIKESGTTTFLPVFDRQ